MRLLMIHVDYFSSTITEKGRSKIFEEVSPNSKTIRVDEALLVLTSVEKIDENNFQISEKAAEEIAQQANQLKVNTIVLHPFAHLFAELSKPEVAIKLLKKIEKSLLKNGFNAVRTPFGWFNSLEIKAKGHQFSRVARIISD